MISDSRKYLLVPRMKKDEAVEFCSQFPNGRFPNSMEEVAQIISKIFKYHTSLTKTSHIIGLIYFDYKSIRSKKLLIVMIKSGTSDFSLILFGILRILVLSQMKTNNSHVSIATDSFIRGKDILIHFGYKRKQVISHRRIWSTSKFLDNDLDSVRLLFETGSI